MKNYQLLVGIFIFSNFKAFELQKIDPIQVYVQEETTLSFQVYEVQEVDLKIAKPMSYFSLLPKEVHLMVNAYWYDKHSPLYFYLLPLRLKKKVAGYLPATNCAAIRRIIDRCVPEEIEANELEFLNFSRDHSRCCKYHVNLAHLAMERYEKKWDLMELLIQEGVDPAASWDYLLQKSVEENNARIVTILLDANKRPTEKQIAKPWEIGLCQGKEEVVRLLIEKGGRDPNCNLPDDVYPIQIAAARNNTAAVRALIAAGAQLNSNRMRYSPLWYAASKNNGCMARLILEAGAATDRKKNPACLYYSYWTDGVYTRSLVKDESNPLYIAVCRLDALKAMLPYYSCVDPSDLEEASPLEVAVSWQCFDSVNMLLAVGADPERKSLFNGVFYGMWAFVRYQEVTEKKINTARRIFVELLNSIQARFPLRKHIIRPILKLHKADCPLKKRTPKRCHFCEFVPELKAKFR